MKLRIVKNIYNIIKKRFKLIRHFAVKGWVEAKNKDKCPNCGYCVMSYLRMIELNATFRVCPVCTYIRKSNGRVYFEGIPKEMLSVA